MLILRLKKYLSVLGAILLLTVGFLLIHRQLWRFDLTQYKEFSLSDQTLKILAHLETPITISAYFRWSDEPDGIFIRRKVQDVLFEYARRSPKITFEMINPDAAVDKVMKEGISSDGVILFQTAPEDNSDIQKKIVHQTDLFDFDLSLPNVPPRFIGENLFTNALLSITEIEQKKICFTTGHDEKDPKNTSSDGMSRLARMLEQENYQTVFLSGILKKSLPDSCHLVVIAGPQRPFSPQEDTILLHYVKSNRALLVLSEIPLDLRQTFNYLQLSLADDTVMDPERHFLVGDQYPSPLLEEHPITSSLIKKEFHPIFYLAQSLFLQNSEKTFIKTTPLLKTSSTAWGETSSEDHKGPLILGATVEETAPVAVVFGDSDFIANGLFNIPGNPDLFLNSVAWLLQEKNKISIRPQPTHFRELILSQTQSRIVYYAVQFAYPLLFLTAAFFIWYRRRSL
ncbi:MAG: hypothetical protein A3I75_06155 [Deltaproteobacteria bacterium RIFCSPLOWO2_02_FULL_50_16]|nr:MAG: hypothetical protein A2053_00400 [Deltaproteobacteria bacterium GWA2_50_8]OGQ55977.1 MAG: hypothetical protein A3I75_06155 [Deltaproteobacteria bacterium RIFCSPLOWO2_02_FULL_50_16]OGQ66417.1 MAG: hypothetical protein A3F89_02640 [Deltaproteobacteria bacterium RIFCSPLOWO2_12_FULL_50_11]